MAQNNISQSLYFTTTGDASYVHTTKREHRKAVAVSWHKNIAMAGKSRPDRSDYWFSPAQ